MNTDKTTNAFQVDLSNCDQEPIHIPGSIQPHGVLLALDAAKLTILQVSNNTWDFFGIHPEKLLNQNLDILLETEQVNFLKDCLDAEDSPIVNPIDFIIKTNNNTKSFDGIIYRCREITILELEPSTSEKNHVFFRFYHLVKLALTKLQAATNIAEISQILAKEVKRITSFDRVMIYRFDENWNGIVIAEEKPEYLTSYLGLHYPASDIPQQARKLYAENWLRIIPNADYQPAAIISTNHPLNHQPLDLGKSVLRSVSPLHIEYLQNMGVTASMSISLLKNQKLWGLIACHHQSPKYIPYEIRSACEFLGQMASIEMSAKEDNENKESKIQLKSVHSKLVEYMSVENNFTEALINYHPNILDLVNATGAAICLHGKYHLVGNTPSHSDIDHLINWLSNHQNQEVFHTDSLATIYPEAEKLRDVVSGLIAISISKSQKNYILWFRREVVQTVNWGGNPHKAVEIKANGSLRLSPRKSFALWQETVWLKSLPWKSSEISAALELRSAIISIVLQKVDELAQLNLELERSNKELDAFAYIASHDLKEPLRGIHNYSNFLMEDYGNIINAEGKDKLITLIRLTQRMEDLIDSLLHFSRLGRANLSMQPTNLNDVVHRILDMLRVRIEESGVEIRIPRPLPTVYCDRVQLGEVFSNLITNAIKYNDKPHKWIEIGYLDHSTRQITFYIQDNGIGIREKHFDSIFRIFKRLHGPSKYGGGTGAGLTIAKKIVERHGGQIWLESTYEEGSIFYFTLKGTE
ncbi:ATP-binding protein [Aliinostoc sp. HNIBRCY26]|uniref:ATP-binding protein n=1 Tax=Aliinostoc sp. HNIBRCY26 TaxID=3418997 RepID=UPI003D073137